jgi:TonB-linked SusC/RagA family outer membrane protein
VNDRISTSNNVAAPYTLAALEPPVIPHYLPNGEINTGRSGLYPTDGLLIFPGTPLGNKLGNKFVNITTNIQTSAHAAYDFIPQLTLKTQFAVQYLQSEEQLRSLSYTTDGYPNGIGSATNQQFLNYSWRNTLKYANNWNENSLTVLVGVTFQRTENREINVNGNTYLSDQLLNLNSAANIVGGGGFGSSYAFQNNLARISYIYNDRYLVTLTGSLNGSSRFGSNKKYGFFPSASVGWIISDENFAQADWLSQLKLTVGYGESGNANGIDNFANLALLGGGKNYNGQPGLTIVQLAKPNLGWETSKQLNVALDYGFDNNRFNGTLTYYRKTTTDLLLPTNVSSTNGFTTFTRNTGKLRNTGVEFYINANIIRNKNLNWSVNANISTLVNKVVDIPSEIPSGHQIAKEGYPIGEFRLKKYVGVDPKNGDALYALKDGSTTSDYSKAPLLLVGDPIPSLYGGFGSSISYKGLDARINFQFVQGNKIYWQNGEFLATNLSAQWNNLTSQLDYWTPDNTDASVPEPRAGGNGNRPSTRYLRDDSYLRLKSATIGYTLPREFVNGYKLRIYVQGTNLATFTNYPGLDPEVLDNSNANINQGTTFFELPEPRVIKFGIQLKL